MRQVSICKSTSSFIKACIHSKAISYPILVKILDDSRDNLHDTAGLAFGEELLLENLVEQFAPSHEFTHKVHMFRIFEGVPERDDVRMLTMPE